MHQLILEWAKVEGFSKWLDDHAAVMRNLSQYLSKQGVSVRAPSQPLGCSKCRHKIRIDTTFLHCLRNGVLLHEEALECPLFDKGEESEQAAYREGQERKST